MRTPRLLSRLRKATEGVAMVEFAYSLVVILPLFLGGAELTSFILAKMRVSQVALHVADNASRIGTDQLEAKPRISEWQINDLLIGANMQAGNLDLENRGRVIISSLEPDPDEDGKFMIRWQRCFGALDWDSSYGSAGDTGLDGIGPASKLATAPDGSGTMFVEVAYDYSPLLPNDYIKIDRIVETAAMIVRDDRDFPGPGGAGLYNPDGADVSSCD